MFDEDVAAGRLLRPRSSGGVASARVTGTLTVPGNVLLNDKAPDAAGAGQAEQNCVIVGNYGMAAWNDGQGFNTGLDVQTTGYTVDGGRRGSAPRRSSPAPAGAPPHFSGSPADTWTSDPVVAVNEKTGEFWYCGLIVRNTGSRTAWARCAARFPAASFTWSAPIVIKTLHQHRGAADKEWLAADSLNGNLYAVWTKFDATGDHIMFSRSTNGGRDVERGAGDQLGRRSRAGAGLARGGGAGR